MKRLAIFVEGQTEQIFTIKLLNEIAGKNNISIKSERAGSDRNGNRCFKIIEARSDVKPADYYVLVRDCCGGGDSTVKSDIIDQYSSLSGSSYEKIIGLRDVYPESHANIPKIIAGLPYGLQTSPIPVCIVLAIMEIEAWFLSEASHFSHIDSLLTQELIISKLQFDPFTENMENRNHPSEDLDDIYRLCGYRYKKKASHVERTVNALDYEAIYMNLRAHVKSLGNFIDQLDSFFN